MLRDEPDCARVIATLQVCGALLIGAVAGLGLALALRGAAGDAALDDAFERLLATRSTAVNLRWALERVRRRVRALPVSARAGAAWHEARAIADEDVVINASIVANGSRAARDTGVPFWVACPTRTLDLSVADGAAIPIEYRDPHELTHAGGRGADGTPGAVRLIPDGVAALDPAFDVTLAWLVDGLISEHGPCAATEAGLRALP